MLLGLAGAASLLLGCGRATVADGASEGAPVGQESTAAPPDGGAAGDGAGVGTTGEGGTVQVEGDAGRFELVVGGRRFPGTLAPGEAGAELASRLPLELDMRELGGNEKYCYTGRPFPGEAEVPERVLSGELWAFSGDCLVLFYEDHANEGYEYVYLGSVDDPTGLASALGTGAARVALS